MAAKMAFMLAAVLAAIPAYAEEPVAAADADPEAWDIRNGCISNMYIKRVNFDSNRDGVIKLTGGRLVKVTLRNNCAGIRSEGYVHRPINDRFCEGDMLRVIRLGTSCIVDKLEPLVAEAAPSR